MKTNERVHDYKHIAVAYQGGGSLGAYHVGALEAMQQAGYTPDVRTTRLILGATRVRDGAPAWFDNFAQMVGPEHVLASGAMPPGFPGVRIDGDLYWDGGCYSNTPLEGIYDKLRNEGDTLCFVIDLFGPNGREPQDIDEVQLTIKEIQFSNRIKNRIRALCERHNYAHFFRHILENHKDAIADHPHRDEIRQLMNVGRFDIIHILYQKPGTEVATCDCEFSKSSIEYRQHQGHSDMKKALAARAEHAQQRRLAQEIAPVGTVVETFAKGMLLKSSFDAGAALARAKRGGGNGTQGLTSPRARGKAMKVPRPQPPLHVAGN